MGTNKLQRGQYVKGNTTIAGDFTVEDDITLSGGVSLSSGLTYSVNLVSSSESVVAGGMNGFSDTGKGRHTHHFASAPVLGLVMECFNVIASGSSVTHKLLCSTDIGATVTINSSAVASARGVILDTSGGACRLVGVSTSEWQVLNLQNATVVAGTSI